MHPLVVFTAAQERQQAREEIAFAEWVERAYMRQLRAAFTIAMFRRDAQFLKENALSHRQSIG